MSRSIACAALAGAALVAAPLAGALAHAYPQTATPPIDGMVNTAPATVAIEFDDELEPRFCSITVTDSAGHRVDDGAAQVAGSDPKRLSVPVKKLAPDTYTVHWAATDTDTHKTSGHYTFMVMQ